METLKGAVLFEDRCYPVPSENSELDRVVSHLGRAALLAPLTSPPEGPVRAGCKGCRLEISNGARTCPRCGGSEALYVVELQGAKQVTQFDFDIIRTHLKELSASRSGSCGSCTKDLAPATGFLFGDQLLCSDHVQNALSRLLQENFERFRKLLKLARRKAKDDEIEPWEYVPAAEAPSRLGPRWEEIQNTYAQALTMERRSRLLGPLIAYPVAAVACSWVGALLGGLAKFLMRTSSNLPFWIGVGVGVIGGVIAMAILRRGEK